MDERVAKLIEEGKASYKKRRDDHLISLGLIDENKTERKYKDRYSSTTKFDEEKNQFYLSQEPLNKF